MKLFEKYLLILLIFLLPTQLAYHFWPNWSFVYGFRIDLLAPMLYLTDLIVAFLILLNLKIFRPIFKYLVILALFALINIFYSVSYLESFYKWFKVFEFIGLSYYIIKQNIVSVSRIINSLFYSSVAVSVIGILQFIKSGTIGGALYYLGERTFATGTPGIALTSLGGVLHLRPYSTFSHPNSLAGFFGVVLIMVLINSDLKNIYIKYIGVVLIGLCIILSFSLGVFISLGIVFTLYLIFLKTNLKKIFVISFFILSVLSSLIFLVVSKSLSTNILVLDENIVQRIDLAFISGQIVKYNFWLGTGLGTFIINIPMYKGILSYSWILQPVHNIYLLILTETGIIGLIFFCMGIYKIFLIQLKRKNKYLLYVFVFIILTGLGDHYWLTLQQNQLLLSLLIGLGLRYDSEIKYEK